MKTINLTLNFPIEQNKTTLTSKVWEIKDKKENYVIKWKKIEQSKSYVPGMKRCNLCLRETYNIIFKKPENGRILLNKNSEIWSSCRHKDKWKVKNYT